MAAAHESTRAYLDLMILRCHRRVRSATFILGVVAVHAPIAGWLLLNGNAPAGRKLTAAAIIGTMLAGYAIAAEIMRSNAAREKQELEAVAMDVLGNSEPGEP